jgi:predicted enzyme related to lactoylglutathione lyase
MHRRRKKGDPLVGERNGFPAGTPCWVDVTTTDLEGTKAFYATLFGWEASTDPSPEAGGYTTFRLRGKDVAAASPSPHPDARTGWKSYITSDLVDATAAKITEAGGSVLAEPFDVLGAGRMAFAGDPTGGVFGIVGANGGLPFSRNPCLGAGSTAGELAWAGTTAQLYANTADPGPLLSSHWPNGQTVPKPCNTPNDPGADTLECHYDYGWNAAADSYAAAVDAYVSLGQAAAGATTTPAPLAWWLDVESENSWTTDPTRNVAALQGELDYLRSVGAAQVGIYTAPAAWASITANTLLFAGLPTWVPGAAILQDAQTRCAGTGSSGGPIQLVQFPLSGFTADYACPVPPASLSFTGVPKLLVAGTPSGPLAAVASSAPATALSVTLEVDFHGRTVLGREFGAMVEDARGVDRARADQERHLLLPRHPRRGSDTPSLRPRIRGTDTDCRGRGRPAGQDRPRADTRNAARRAEAHLHRTLERPLRQPRHLATDLVGDNGPRGLDRITGRRNERPCPRPQPGKSDPAGTGWPHSWQRPHPRAPLVQGKS